MAAHSPGPWTYEVGEHNGYYHRYASSGIAPRHYDFRSKDRWIGRLFIHQPYPPGGYRNPQQAFADILLITAGPQMLKALKKIVNHWDDLHPKDRQQARAAIAAATVGLTEGETDGDL